MKRVIRFESEYEPGYVLVEVEDGDGEDAGRRKVARAGQIVETANQSFEQAMQSIRPMINNLRRTVAGLAETPNETTLKFGVKLGGQAGAIIASTSIEATCEITIKWKA